MVNRKIIGDKGEQQAAHYLRANGYEILETNWRSGKAEIDIIARKEDIMAFIEVKTRKNNDFGYPESFVSESQQERIHYAAEEYLEKLNWRGQVSFDILAITTESRSLNLEHFEDAF